MATSNVRRSHAGLVATGIILAFAFSAAPSASQVLRGHVLNEADDQPIPGVYLELIGPDGEAVLSRLTDETGAFEFRAAETGYYRLRGTHLGFRETVSGFVNLRAGEEVDLEFRMAEEAILLDPITVTASPRPWYEHLKAPALWEYYERSEYLGPLGRGHFLGPEEIRNLQGMPVTMAVGTVPGMQAVAADNSARFHLVGRRGCDALFFLNGMQVRLRPPASRADTVDLVATPGPEPLEWFVDDFVTMTDVEAIEVYRGPSELPGEFHGHSGNAHCGAVVVWTKRNVDRGGER